jgi:molecular chaperone GrpE
MTDEHKENMNNEEEEITFEPETDGDQAAPQKDLAEKVKKLKAELEAVKKEKQEYLDGWQRMRADMVNMKKREEDERVAFRKFATEGMVEELLPVVESFNLAMANKEAWEKVDANWRAGVEYIAKQLTGTLESYGLAEINPLNALFSPEEHEAIEHVAVTEKDKDHVVVEVISKGYKLHGKVLKPARVKVGEFK